MLEHVQRLDSFFNLFLMNDLGDYFLTANQRSIYNI